MTVRELSELQLDALREVGSIGAGHAATALSQLVERPILLDAPTLEVISQSEISTAFTSPEQVVCAVYASLLGDIGGGILFMATSEAALSLLDLLHGQLPGTTLAIGSDDAELLGHVGTIMISAHLAAISRMTGLDVLPSSPTMVLDMAGAILQTAALELDVRAEQAVLIRTVVLDEPGIADSALFFLPDPASMAVLLGRLGLV